ncbi:MAG TPA: glutaredoxin 3 [Stellaceae bacterium]|jgi:glutaredoxin 3|nr:glutaredoxin 3 [Stellaceae bacterium]
MAKVEMYSTMFCPYCARARSLLQRKGVTFTDIDVDAQPDKRDEMVKRANGRYTVPQIFIDDEHVGGSDDLMALESAGKLDAKLGVQP